MRATYDAETTKGTNDAALLALKREGEDTNGAAPSTPESEDTEYPPAPSVRGTHPTPTVPPNNTKGDKAGMPEPSVLGAQPELKAALDKANTATLLSEGAKSLASTTHFDPATAAGLASKPTSTMSPARPGG